MTTNALTTRTGALSATQLDYFLVDGSGSMMDKWWESIGALQAYVDVLKTANIGSHGIVHVFDGNDLGNIQRDAALAEWPTMESQPLAANWSSTPLYDAINLMVRELAALDPARCSIVIVTDGQEAGSKYTNVDQAKALLDWCRAKGWSVTFIGADFNNSTQAKLLGADASNSIGVQKKLLLEAGKTLGEKRVRHALAGTDINFSDDEKTQFGGYLAAPEAAK